VFEVDDSVFGTSVLAKVHAAKVELKKGNSLVTLELEDVEPSGGSSEGISSDEEGSEFTVPEEELSDALANLPRLLSQARAVPYFRNGKSIGMRLFAIRKGSMYEKLGLKNGDIIKSVNDNSLSDPSQALKIFNQLKDERSISVVLERAGADKSLSYSIE
jgi:general secretion pathway protein C